MINGISVEFVDKMGSDLSVVNSARVSFAKVSDVLTNGDVKLIEYLADHNHTTPFRHNQIMIRCKAPIFIARQLGKHQAGLSWNEVSRRYVSDAPEFYVPDEWRGRPEGSIKQGSAGVVKEYPVYVISQQEGVEDGFYYEDLVEMCKQWYELNVDNIAPEMARMALPQSMITEWIWSGNLLAFAHVYKERIAPNAQLEAQEFAKQLDKVIRPHFPISWGKLVGEDYD